MILPPKPNPLRGGVHSLQGGGECRRRNNRALLWLTPLQNGASVFFARKMYKTFWSHLDLRVGGYDLGHEIGHEIGFHDLCRKISAVGTIFGDRDRLLITEPRDHEGFSGDCWVVHKQIP